MPLIQLNLAPTIRSFFNDIKNALSSKVQLDFCLIIYNRNRDMLLYTI